MAGRQKLRTTRSFRSHSPRSTPSTSSFPSGHSTLAAATFLTLAALIASLEPRRRTKGVVYGLAVTILVAVGASRVYLGVHYPSDVLAGWCLGATWALAALSA